MRDLTWENNVTKAIESSLGILKSSTHDAFYKKNAFKLVACFLSALINTHYEADSLYNTFLNFR